MTRMLLEHCQSLEKKEEFDKMTILLGILIKSIIG